MLFPSVGRTLPLEGAYLFKVAPVEGSTGYLFGFFQNGTAVWENYANERALSGTEYAITPGTPAHNAIRPGPLQVWVRALVGGEWTEATIVDVTVAPAANAGPGGGPIFYCIIGPNGTCPDGTGTPAQPTELTYNDYLNYLDGVAEGIAGASSALSCGKDPLGDLALSCLGVLFKDYPAISTSLDGIGCVGTSYLSQANPSLLKDAIRSCVGTAAFGLKLVVWAVRKAAEFNPELQQRLNTRMI
jgi:hypothetical protein